MNIYCVATLKGDLNPSVFKLVSTELWRWECKLNTLYFFQLEDIGTCFFKPARLFERVVLMGGELFAKFEEGDLDE